MRIPCPHCGDRDLREFFVLGSAELLRRPDPAAPNAGTAFQSYVYSRSNPAGRHAELFQHVGGCRRWLVVTRDTRSHVVDSVADAAEVVS